MKSIEELTTRELDEAVAGELFGWKRRTVGIYEAWENAQGEICDLEVSGEFSTDPAANERVLGWILDHEPEDASTFMDACNGEWSVGYITRNDGEFQQTHKDRLVCVCRFALSVARASKGNPHV